MQQLRLFDIGLVKYQKALEIQTQEFDLLAQNKINNVSNKDLHRLILCEHYPVITLGKSAKKEHILCSEDFLTSKDIELVQINRGGDITFHGPGQIVGYPILDLDFFTSDLKEYMRMLEEVIILVLSAYGLEGFRIPGETGVWLLSKVDQKPKKIAAFGVKTSRWITMHGFALNVNVLLDYFNYIVPCGIADKGVTSMEQELALNHEIYMDTVKQHIIDNFAKVFDAQIS